MPNNEQQIQSNRMANEELDRRLKLLEEKKPLIPEEKPFVDVQKDGQRMIQDLSIGTLRNIVTKIAYGLLTDAQKTNLTDAGATTLHKHDHGGMDGLGDDDHTQYRLESADHNHQTTGLQAGKIDHGSALDGLDDNDHGAIYYTQAQVDALVAAAGGISNVAIGSFTLAHPGEKRPWTENIVAGFVPKILFLFGIQGHGTNSPDISLGAAIGINDAGQECVEMSNNRGEDQRTSDIFYNNYEVDDYVYGRVTTWASTVVITFTPQATYGHSAQDEVLLWVALK